MIEGESVQNIKIFKENKSALMLEGGAMRGLFTAGVLDAFMEHKLYFAKTVAISAGTMQGLGYLSRQKGRNYKANIVYSSDRRYMGLEHLICEGSYFNFNFIYGDLAHKLIPYDFDEFNNTDMEMLAVITRCDTGECVYISNLDMDEKKYLNACRASCAMPLFSKAVNVEGIPCVDGGVAMPLAPLPDELPFECIKPVYILTRDIKYRKKEISSLYCSIIKKFYGSEYPKIAEMICSIPAIYNEKVEKLLQLEKEGKAFVIRPEHEVEVSRVERNRTKLKILYKEGYKTGMDRFDEMMRWIREI